MSNLFGSRSFTTRSEVEVKCHHKLDSYMRMTRIGKLGQMNQA